MMISTSKKVNRAINLLICSMKYISVEMELIVIEANFERNGLMSHLTNDQLIKKDK